MNAGQFPFITKENAHELQELAVLTRNFNKQARLNGTMPVHANPRIKLVKEQITRARKQLNTDLPAKDRAQLIRALDVLLDREREFAGVPRLKHGQANRTAPHVLAQPLDEVKPTVS